MPVSQADIHLIKSHLIGHTQQARAWANNQNRCTDPRCAAVMNEHCDHLDSVVSMLKELERMVTRAPLTNENEPQQFDHFRKTHR